MQDHQSNDQKNFIIAMVLSGIVLLGYWFFFGKPLAEKARENAAQEIAKAEAIEANPPLPIQAREVLIAKNEGERIKIDSAALKGSFFTTGSRFDDISLKNYNKTLDPADGNITLLSPEGAEKSAYLMDNWTTNIGDLGDKKEWVRVSGNILTENTPVKLKHESDGLTVQRTISVDDKFLITFNDKVTNNSTRSQTITRKGVARQHNMPDDLTNFIIIQEGPVSIVDNKYHDLRYKNIMLSKGINKEKTWSAEGEAGWAGLTDKYWLIGNIAPQGETITANYKYYTKDDKNIQNITPYDQDVYETSYELKSFSLSAGASIDSVSHMYVGPKERSTLLEYEAQGLAEMERAIDWGLMRIVVKPISTALSFLGAKLGNYGVGILVLTFFIKLVMFPLFNKQYASQAKMKKVQPKVKKLQELYKDDRMKMQQEMMAIYKKEGVNPAAGCLPVIPTIFVFFSLYKAVFINIDLRHEPFFGWIRDLSAKDPLSILNGFGLLPWDAVPGPIPSILAIGPLAILYGITMRLMYTLTPPAGDPMQAKIFKWMPWVFMFIYYITRKFKVDTPVDQFWRKITGKEEPAKD